MMDWISQIFFAVCLCSIAGSCGLLEWRLLLPVLERRRPDWILPMLKLTVLLYLCPIGYVLVYFGLMDSTHERFFSALFLTTNIISVALKVFAVVWLVAICVQLPQQVRLLRRDIRMRRGDVPLEQEGVEELFREICGELGIRRPIDLVANDLCFSPVRTGIVRPAILLPYGVQYSEKELRMIFLHELTHYLHCDLGTKIACFLVQLIHWFNPAAGNLVEIYEDWSETACDLAVCRAGGEFFHPREYAETLLAHVEVEEEEEEGKKKPMTFFISLYGTEKVLERRVERMCNMKRTKKPLPKFLAILLAAVFVTVNNVPAYAASHGMAGGYDWIYKSTRELELEVPEMEELAEPAEASEGYFVNEAGEIEIPADMVDWDSMNVIEKGLNDTPTRLVKEYEWDIPANTFCRSFGFSASAGEHIGIFVDCDSTILCGIIEPDGTLRAVRSSGYFSHSFALDQTGTYRFFVENENNFEIFVTATLSVL